MTRRERVLTSLNHQEPDRVALDLSGHRSSGISAIAYARLRDHLGLPRKPIRVYDPVQQLAIVDEDVLELFEVDTIEMGRGFALTDDCWREWVLPDGTPCQLPVWIKPEREANRWILRAETGEIISQMPDGVLFFEQCYYPFAEQEDSQPLSWAYDRCMWAAAASPPGPLTGGPDGDRLLAQGARSLREQSDRLIIGLFGGNLLETGQMFYRNDNFLMMLAGEPARAHRFLDRLVEEHLAKLEKFLGAAGPHIDVILFGDDLGSQKGPQISPRMYREFFKARHQQLWQTAKKLAPVKVMLHCCGGVRPLLADLIEAGLDAINPVQISCQGMNARELKAEFGRHLVFWGGGCDTRELLTKGTPDQIRRHVAEQVEILAPGGGFVFQQVHNIMADVPAPNIVAMYEALGRNLKP
ncbi:MAG TPA: uroporphyrinogen decarboxylase family protein [Candidatus Paceibacterota bacterium]|nr:uroporphyrinogen decarboxylase family protein [Candidatus Paceibacterota bacterium]HSA01057.1 uroporphyrinogen decarboxylase family protein [Candidatus Paceibacterota bacterium]